MAQRCRKLRLWAIILWKPLWIGLKQSPMLALRKVRGSALAESLITRLKAWLRIIKKWQTVSNLSDRFKLTGAKTPCLRNSLSWLTDKT
jgi:hypothetical protein